MEVFIKVWQEDFRHSFWAFVKKFTTKCDKKTNVTNFKILLLRPMTKDYYRLSKVVKSEAEVITKCDRYYKVR